MKRKFKSTLAIVLSVAVMFTFIPMMGGTVMAASKLAAPKVKVTDTTDSTVSLSWGKVKGAKSYKVYQNVDGSFKAVKKTTKKNVVISDLEQDTEYEFKVRAAKKKNGKSLGKYSKAVKATTISKLQADINADAQAIYAQSKEATAYSEYLADELSFNPAYWDSNEGWRTAGSDAEHKAAKFLKNEWEKIGLEDVTLEKVPLDKYQFNDADLTILNGGKETVKLGFTDKESDSVISYAVNGAEIKSAEIVDAGTGSIDDYATMALEGKDVEGKVVLVGVDQWNKGWVTAAYAEAATQGAIGVISYQKPDTADGYKKTYANYDSDTNHVQDICCADLGLPLVGISINNAKKIQDAIKAGDAKVNMNVDCEMVKNGGYTYNVVGKIKGSGNTGQQILYAGHYDKYFYGYEDDNLATGLVGGIAKAMVDANYEPENDIYFIAHGAEEWGQTGTAFDWAIGSWGQISKNHPEWQGTTLALYNFELPGIDNDNGQVVLSSAENAGLANATLESGILKGKKSEFNSYLARYSSAGFVCADTICYEELGVPCYMNYTINSKADLTGADNDTWYMNRYHTNRDADNARAPRLGNKKGVDGEYSSDLMQAQLETYSALGITTDQTPALVLDFDARCDLFADALEGTDEIADISAYKDALAKLRGSASENKKAGDVINNAYKVAYNEGDEAEIKEVKEDAIAYNKESLKAFKKIQDAMSIESGSLTEAVSHEIPQANYDIYTDGIKLLKFGSAEGALWGSAENGLSGFAALNGWYEWAYATTCSEDTLNTLMPIFKNDENNWGKNIEWEDGLETAWLTTNTLYKDLYWYNYEDPSKVDCEPYIAPYTEYQGICKTQVQKYVDIETGVMNDAASILY